MIFYKYHVFTVPSLVSYSIQNDRCNAALADRTGLLQTPGTGGCDPLPAVPLYQPGDSFRSQNPIPDPPSTL